MRFFAAFLCLFFCAVSPASAQFVTVKNVNAPEKFPLREIPKNPPKAVFYDADGNSVRFTDFQGKIVLINVWSKACAQCIVELPMLDALQKSFGDAKFKIVPLSVGGESAGQLTLFFRQKKLKHIRPYVDSASQAALASGVSGLPTTLLLNEKGEEIGRIRGIAEWTGAPIKAQIRSLIRERLTAKGETGANPDAKDSETAQNAEPLNRETVLKWFKK